MAEQKLIDGRQAHVTVIGAGAFGVALAASAQAGGNKVTLVGREPERFHEIRTDGALSQCELILQTEYSKNPAESDLILLAVPCQSMRSASEWLNSRRVSNAPLWIMSAAKGIETGSLKLPHEILTETFDPAVKIGTLSGPSFAQELRKGLMTSLVAASHDENLRQRAVSLLHRSFFRIYPSIDILGTELCGAMKNVIAVVVGAVDGLGLGNNARAAVMTRGFGEIAQMGHKLGASPMTFLGLAGLGDLILTCTGDMSRNRQFGMRLAKGERIQDILSSAQEVVEGYATTQSAYEVSRKLSLDTPIINAAYAVLYEGRSVLEVMVELTSRQGRGEFEWNQ